MTDREKDAETRSSGPWRKPEGDAAPEGGNVRPGASGTATVKTDAPEKKKEPSRSGGAGRTLSVALLAAVVALGAAGAYVHFRVGDLERELAAQREARAELANRVAAVRSDAAGRAELEALGARTALLEAERARLADRSEIDSLAAALRRELAGLEEKVGGLSLGSLPDAAAGELLARLAVMDLAGEDERAWNRAGVRAAARALVARRLGDRVDAGLSYLNELAAARALGLPDGGGGEDPFAALAPHAAAGVAPPAALLAALPALVGEGAAARAGEEGAPFWDSLLHRISGLVEVRRTAPPEGGSPDAALARATLAARAGDLAGALAEVGSVPPDALPGLREWRDSARRTAAAERAARALAEAADAALLAHVAGRAPE